MKYILTFTVLFIAFVNVVAADYDYSPQVEKEFKNFFGLSVYKSEAYISGVEIIGDKISDMPKSIPITLKFNMNKKITKVLLLKAGGNYYSNSGLYSDKCAKEPVNVFSYTNKNNSDTKELKVVMRTKCNRHPIVLLLWVKTVDGEFYHTSFPFYTTSS